MLSVSYENNNFVSFTDSSKNNESDGSISAPHPTGIILHRVGYYTIPSLEELTPLVDGDGRCIVENFTIGRRNYGNIFYPDSFDVSGLDIDSIGKWKESCVLQELSKKRT